MPHDGDFAVVVDYAHTDDALLNTLKTARELTKGRIITVFGCGGDRDRSKRRPMGEIAGNYSDLVIVTSDNPRNEDPMKDNFRDRGRHKAEQKRPIRYYPTARGDPAGDVVWQRAVMS